MKIALLILSWLITIGSLAALNYGGLFFPGKSALHPGWVYMIGVAIGVACLFAWVLVYRTI